jgi:hypothetical protein
MFRYYQECIMQQLGNLQISMFLVNPVFEGEDENNMFTRRMRRVTIFRMHCITRDEAEKYSAKFLRENALDNENLYQTQSVWTATEYL